MKVILLKDVPSQGKKGTVKEVSDGYARNFLLPRGLAVPATDSAMNELRQAEASQKHKLDTEIAEAKALVKKLESVTVCISLTKGADDRPYGSVTSKEIAELLSAQHGITIDKRKIVMKDPIKAFGTFTFDVKLYAEVVGKLNVVVAEKK